METRRVPPPLFASPPPATAGMPKLARLGRLAAGLVAATALACPALPQEQAHGRAAVCREDAAPAAGLSALANGVNQERPPARENDPLRVAVAANFRAAFDSVSQTYPQKLAAAFGSSGLLHAQIVQGRPFDLFLSADSARPQALLDAGLAFAPVAYAVGRLVLLVNTGQPGPNWLTAKRRVAIANPDAAPYGRAAAQVLAAQPAPVRRVTAMNVAQAFHFARSGAVDGAFVAYAQVRAEDVPADRYWLVPASLHQPIEQVAVAIRGGDEAGAKAFLAFLGAPPAQTRIHAAGYLANTGP